MKSFPSNLKVNSITSFQRRPITPSLVLTRQRTSRKSRFPCFAQQGDLYEVLGVDRSASTKEIKSAFKRKALKLHPDVNKAPDAAEKFKEVRVAYQVLVNEDTRAQHDGKLRTGTSPFWSDFGQSSRSRGASGYSPKPVYGLGDVFRDLGEAFSDFNQNRGSKEETIGSLWEELGNLGEEFVEFLEQEAGISPRDDYEPPVPESDSKKSTPPPSASKDEGMNSEDLIDKALKDLKKQMGL